MGDRRSPLPAGAQSPISSVDANARPDPPGGRWRRFWRASRRHRPDVRMPNARCPASPSGSAVTMNTSSVTTNRSTTFGATSSKIRCDGHLIARILPSEFAATGGRGGRPPVGATCGRPRTEGGARDPGATDHGATAGRPYAEGGACDPGATDHGATAGRPYTEGRACDPLGRPPVGATAGRPRTEGGARDPGATDHGATAGRPCTEGGARDA